MSESKTVNKKTKAIFAGLIIAAAFLAYFPAISAPFHFDDQATIVMNPALWHITDIGKVLAYKKDLPRPISNISIALDSSIYKTNPAGFHATNLLIHAMCAILVWLFCVEIFRAAKMDEKTGALGGLFAGLIFAVHPATSEAAIYIWSRSSSLMAFFVLASAIFWIKGAKESSAKKIAASFFLYILAIGAKEEAVFFPVFLLVLEFVLFDSEGRKKRLAYSALFWAAPLFPLVARFAVGENRLDFVSWRAGQSDAVAWRAHSEGLLSLVPYNFLTQAKVAVEFFKRLLWPLHLSVDHGVTFEAGAPSAEAIVGVIALSMLAAAFLYFRKRNPPVSIAIALSILPTAMFLLVPVTDTMVERRFYLPTAGFAMLAGYLFAISAMFGKKRTIALFATLLVLMAALTFERVLVWRDPIALWSGAVRTWPAKLRPRNVLAQYLYDNDMVYRAANLNIMTLGLDRYDTTTIQNLGLIYLGMGRFEIAERYFKKAIDIHPEAGFNARYNLGVVYEEMGKTDAAAAEFAKSIEINSGMATSHLKLGLIAQSRNDIQSAVSHFRKAVEINPEFVEARMNLGNALVDAGLKEEGIAELREAEKLAPDDPLLKYNLGMSLLGAGNIGDAEAEFIAAARLNLPQAHFGLALASQQKGDAYGMASEFGVFLEMARAANDPSLAPMVEYAIASMKSLQK